VGLNLSFIFVKIVQSKSYVFEEYDEISIFTCPNVILLSNFWNASNNKNGLHYFYLAFSGFHKSGSYGMHL